jgi:hypothetical protein
MKKLSSLVAISVLLCVLMSGGNRSSQSTSQDEKKNCIGYTIIEAGKGINCSGDTVNLVRKQGFVEFTTLKNHKQPV